MWRNDVYMHALPDGGFVFTAWELATETGIHAVVQCRAGALWAQLVSDDAYQRIYEAFPAARAGIEHLGTVLLALV